MLQLLTRTVSVPRPPITLRAPQSEWTRQAKSTHSGTAGVSPAKEFCTSDSDRDIRTDLHCVSISEELLDQSAALKGMPNPREHSIKY